MIAGPEGWPAAGLQGLAPLGGHSNKPVNDAGAEAALIVQTTAFGPSSLPAFQGWVLLRTWNHTQMYCCKLGPKTIGKQKPGGRTPWSVCRGGAAAHMGTGAPPAPCGLALVAAGADAGNARLPGHP